MDVAIGLPNAVPGTTGEQLTEWARRAEARGFSSLGTIDRIALRQLRAADRARRRRRGDRADRPRAPRAAGPLRANAVVLAKQALSLHALSGGRLTLGIGLGGRDDDYAIAGLEIGNRGEDLDAMLERIKEVWDGEEMGPGPTRRRADRRRRRRGLLRARRPLRRRLDRRRRAAGPVRRVARRSRRPGQRPAATASRADGPRLLRARRRRRGGRQRLPDDYYAWLGEETAGYIAAGAAKDADTVKRLPRRLRGGRLRRADPLPELQRPRPGRPARRRGRL